jgi:hypothetical protein
MKNRRKFLTVLITGFVALTVAVGSTFADELLGYITKVDVEGKKLTVVSKEDSKEVIVTTTDKTEWVAKDGSAPIDLAKIAKNIEKAEAKAKDAGKTYKGINVTVTHEKGVASKIVPAAKKKAAN